MVVPGVNAALRQYRQVQIAAIEESSPQSIIQMLLEGAQRHVVLARKQLQEGEIAGKCAAIGRVLGILDGLRASLKPEVGGDAGKELAGNLDALYDYMQRRLVEANLRNDESLLNEVAGLLGEIKDAWDNMSKSRAA